MKKSNFLWSTDLNKVICKYLKKNDLANAEKHFSNFVLEKPSSETLFYMTTQFAKFKNFQKTIYYFSKFEDYKISYEEKHFVFLFQFLLKYQDYPKILQYHEKMLNLGITESEDTYYCIAQCYLFTKKYTNFFQILSKSNNQVLYTFSITHFLKIKDMESATKILHISIEKELKIISIYPPFVEYYTSINDKDGLQRIFEYMKRFNIEMSEDIATHYFNGFIIQNRVEKALEIFHTYKHLIKSSHKFIIERLLEKDESLALELYKSIQSEVRDIDSVHIAFFDHYAKNKRPETLQLYEKLSHLTYFWRKLIPYFISIGDSTSLLNLLDEHHQDSLDLDNYEIIICYFLNKKDLDIARDIMYQCYRIHGGIGVRVYHKFLKMYLDEKDLKRSEEMLNIIFKKNIPIHYSIIEKLKSQKEFLFFFNKYPLLKEYEKNDSRIK